MRGAPRSEQGSTLIEVLISVVILGLAISALLGGMTTTVGSSSLGRQQADAEALLTSATEAVRDPTLTRYQCPGNYSLTGILPVPARWSVTVAPDGQWDGSNFQPTCNGNMQKLTVTVTSPTGQVTMSREVVKGASS